MVVRPRFLWVIFVWHIFSGAISGILYSLFIYDVLHKSLDEVGSARDLGFAVLLVPLVILVLNVSAAIILFRLKKESVALFGCALILNIFALTIQADRVFKASNFYGLIISSICLFYSGWLYRRKIIG